MSGTKPYPNYRKQAEMPDYTEPVVVPERLKFRNRVAILLRNFAGKFPKLHAFVVVLTVIAVVFNVLKFVGKLIVAFPILSPIPGEMPTGFPLGQWGYFLVGALFVSLCFTALVSLGVIVCAANDALAHVSDFASDITSGIARRLDGKRSNKDYDDEKEKNNWR